MSRKNKENTVELRLLAEVAKRLASGGLSASDLQAVLEKRPFGESSLDGKIVASFEGIDFTERNFRETIVYNDQLLKRHRNGGGWVPVEQDMLDESMPFVADTAYVGPSARVVGHARVTKWPRILGGAVIRDYAYVTDGAMVSNLTIAGYLKVTGVASLWTSDDLVAYKKQHSS